MKAVVFDSFRPFPARIFFGLLIVLSANIEISAEETLLSQGQAVSEKHCSRCHVVGKFNSMGGISSTPSFSILVNGLSDWQERFASFYTRLPHPSIIRMEGEDLPVNYLPTSYPIHLKREHIAAIVEFAGTLKK